MSEPLWMLAGVLGLVLVMIGVMFVSENVVPALRHRADRKHELRMERVRLEQRRLEAARPLCTSCGHGLGFHDAGMACRADTEHPVERTDTGTVTVVRLVPCKCTEYTGQAPGLSGSILRELDK